MKTMMAGLVLAAAALLATGAGCGNRTLRFDLVPVDSRIMPQVIESSDADWLTTDRVAMVTVSGMISNSKGSSLLGSGYNPVSDFRETLDAIAKDDNVKAVVLRINSPGGTVTGSAMMYHDLLEFKAKTHKPVVTCMMDLCASGGYYLSCASDYRIAYPTTITGSIGVIVESININGTLKKIGVATEAVKSGPNKDMASPFKPAESMDKPLTENDRELLQNVVTQFYEGFKEVVKKSPQHIKDSDWGMLTDGRVVTGKDAAAYGLIDEVGDLNGALAKAKAMANIKKAKVVIYKRSDEAAGSVYASNPGIGNATPQMNLLNLNVDLGDLIPRGQSEFLYMWTGFGKEE
jgi:protease-4